MNINTQKKNCRRCIAGKHSNYECDLGYKREVKSYDEYGFTKFGIPLEPCPKPKTTSDYIFAKKWYLKVKNMNNPENLTKEEMNRIAQILISFDKNLRITKCKDALVINW